MLPKAQIARDVAHKFLRVGVRASVYDDSHMMLMSASLLGPEDVAIRFSYSGNTVAVIETIQLARRNGARIITTINCNASPLAQQADVVLCSKAQGSPLMGENAAARIAQLNILDALFVAVAQRDYKAADQHPWRRGDEFIGVLAAQLLQGAAINPGLARQGKRSGRHSGQYATQLSAQIAHCDQRRMAVQTQCGGRKTHRNGHCNPCNSSLAYQYTDLHSRLELAGLSIEG